MPNVALLMSTLHLCYSLFFSSLRLTLILLFPIAGLWSRCRAVGHVTRTRTQLLPAPHSKRHTFEQGFFFYFPLCLRWVCTLDLNFVWLHIDRLQSLQSVIFAVTQRHSNAKIQSVERGKKNANGGTQLERKSIISISLYYVGLSRGSVGMYKLSNLKKSFDKEKESTRNPRNQQR